jgi:hypothetical protein
MIVELHVFSGRPNPRWELDALHADALTELQRELKPSKQTPSIPPALGYSGFSYVTNDRPVVVYDGYVRLPGDVLDDPSFTIERFLLDQLPEEYQLLRDRIVAQVQRSRRQ